MHAVEFLSDEWLQALDAAARHRHSDGDDPLATVSISIEQAITDGPRWRLVIDHGTCRVETDAAGDPDVRLTCDRATAAAIASGQRPALHAFTAGDLRLGGDVQVLLEQREALEALGDLFAAVKDQTTF